MAPWSVVGPKNNKVKLSRWLTLNGFTEGLAQAVQGRLVAREDIDKLQDVRAQALGEDGLLSRAQRKVLVPAGVALKDGKLVGLKVPRAPGGTAQQVDGSGTNTPGARARREQLQLAQLKEQLAAQAKQIQALTAVAGGAK